MILETKRLYLREMNPSDFNSLCRILQDEKAMYAYEGAFSNGLTDKFTAIKNGTLVYGPLF